MLMSRSPSSEGAASFQSDSVVDPTELRICFEVLILSTIQCP